MKTFDPDYRLPDGRTMADKFGDPHRIDILIETRGGEVLMILVCHGFIDGAPETQRALLDKMRGYLDHTQSGKFRKKYADWPVTLRVAFNEPPDQRVMALLIRCRPWAADYGVRLEFEIGGKQVRFAEQG